MQAGYLEIADDLQRRIEDGEWTPGERLRGPRPLPGTTTPPSPSSPKPSASRSCAAGSECARAAEHTCCHPQPPRCPIDLGHQVRRNDLGYVFARPDGHWPPSVSPLAAGQPAPRHGGPPRSRTGQQVFTRRREETTHVTGVAFPAPIYRVVVPLRRPPCRRRSVRRRPVGFGPGDADYRPGPPGAGAAWVGHDIDMAAALDPC